MFSAIGGLWRGKLPFRRAFWVYAVVYGLILNVLASIAALATYSATGSIVLFLAAHFLPLPYNFLACLGAWRSAGNLQMGEWHVTLAKGASVATFLALLLL